MSLEGCYDNRSANDPSLLRDRLEDAEQEINALQEDLEEANDRVEDLEAENEHLRRAHRDILLALRWREAKAHGKMREMQENGTDDQHSRLREGRYEAAHDCFSAVKDISPVSLNENTVSDGEGSDDDV